jgi:hypothetical protein
MQEVELHDLHVFVDVLRGGINVLRVGALNNGSPFQHRLRALLVLVFVTKGDLGPIRQGQPELDPHAADVQLQIAAEIERRRRE